MVRTCGIRWLPRLAAWAAAVLVPAASMAAERPKGEPKPQAEVVELFSGIERGQIEVQLIPRDSTQCNLLVTNKTDKPLSVRLPAVFAAVPVLAQFQFPQPQAPNRFPAPGQAPQVADPNAPQRLGAVPDWTRDPFRQQQPGGRQRQPGGFPPFGGGPMAGQGPLFNIAPERVGKVKLPAVCLDHGKPNPLPQSKYKYEVKPLESVTDKQGVAEVCVMLSRGEVNQQIAQLAAWNLNNDLSWEKLAKTRQKGGIFGSTPTYSKAELQAAKKTAEKAVKLAQERKQPSQNASTSVGQR